MKEKLEQFNFNAIKGRTGKIKSFFVVGCYKFEDENIKCQIRDCKEDACWGIKVKGVVRVFCFDHGEDL